MQTGKVAFDDNKMKAARLETALFPEMDWMKPENARYLTIMGIEQENNKQYYAIKVSSDAENESIHYYEKGTFKKWKTVKTIVNKGESFTATTEYDEYLPVKGLLFPHKSVLNVGEMTFTTKTEEIKVNAKVNVADFQ